jgi:hypothetical protein
MTSFPERQPMDGCDVQEPGGPVASAQNMLGLGLFLVLALGCGNILLKALVITWSIFAAAIQYSFVGLLFIVIIIFVTP